MVEPTQVTNDAKTNDNAGNPSAEIGREGEGNEWYKTRGNHGFCLVVGDGMNKACFKLSRLKRQSMSVLVNTY